MHELVLKCGNHEIFNSPQGSKPVLFEYHKPSAPKNYFFVSHKEHLRYKRPVTRYDFKAITHNKNNGLPKFKRSGGQLTLLEECKLL